LKKNATPLEDLREKTIYLHPVRAHAKDIFDPWPVHVPCCGNRLLDMICRLRINRNGDLPSLRGCCPRQTAVWIKDEADVEENMKNRKTRHWRVFGKY
jgi:hypothetical protein